MWCYCKGHKVKNKGQEKSLQLTGFEDQVRRWALDRPHTTGFNSGCALLRWEKTGQQVGGVRVPLKWNKYTKVEVILNPSLYLLMMFGSEVIKVYHCLQHRSKILRLQLSYRPSAWYTTVSSSPPAAGSVSLWSLVDASIPSPGTSAEPTPQFA